jgi:hypothetical protein
MQMRRFILALILTTAIAAPAAAQRTSSRGGEPPQQYLDTPYMPIEQYLMLLTYPEVQEELKMDLKQKATLREWVYAPFMPRVDRGARFRNFTKQNEEFFTQLLLRGNMTAQAIRSGGYDSWNVWAHMQGISTSQERARQSQEMVEALESAPRLSPEETASHLRAVAQRIPDLLSDKQLQRLSELTFQLNGPLSLTDMRVARLAQLSPDHSSRIANIGKMLSTRLRDLEKYYPEIRDNKPTAVFGGREDAVSRRLREADLQERRWMAMNKEKGMAEEAIVQLLDQREQNAWALLLGKPFKPSQQARGIYGALKP